ncbi:MAG: hypothetical protein CL766_07765 [Chloroflexi bacterium]|jgi:hypothetical protein|nr:hypothetical protein [Chloroflexota bacterium]MCH2304729.1 YIP1 family protein [SAR202 cluster bacterium]|tara:strand:- start:18 stop:530 length:513 start_codon:yes stop_codon:yes gene_type:complete
MINRIIGVLTLNVNTYEEIEADKNATIQSFSIVVLSSIVTAIILKPDTGFSLPNFISAIIIGIFLWGLWALVTMFVGTKLLPTQETSSNWGELARTTGYAQAPKLFSIFALIPILTTIVLFIVGVWNLITMIIAIRQALDYTSTWRAVFVVLLGFLPYAIIASLVISLLQ